MPKYSNRKAGVTRYPADKWFSMCVRLANNNQCEACNGEATDCAHIYGRRKYATRWSKLNCISMCRRCHQKYTVEPCEWADFIDAKWPGRREKLLVMMQAPGKNTPEIRAAISKHYNKEFRRMERTGERDFESWN